MGIKRYYATKDNTITNAYKANLTTRGVSGNMGQSDILEIFYIYGQASSASSEISRVLVEFDTTSIDSDRNSGIIPASGSVEFFLKMYNAEHPQTTPKDFTVVVSAVSQSWEEGLGLDMEEYSDEDASNWVSASQGTNWTDFSGRATAEITVTDAGGTLNDQTFILSNSAGTGTTYETNTTIAFGSQPGGAVGNTIQLGISGIGGGASGKVNLASAIAASINATTNADFTAVSDGVDKVTVTQATPGIVGNKSNTNVNVDGITVGNFTGGTSIEGGSFKTGSDANDDMYTYKQTFDSGFENLEINVSNLVEDWIKGESGGGWDNYGFGVYLTGSIDIGDNSYYTKKFFARGSQFYHKRPVLEARWDDSKKDNRGEFYLSSTMVPETDNLMKLYLYNTVRGKLTDIPYIGTGELEVSIFSGNIDNTSPTGSRIGFGSGGGTVSAGQQNTTASYVETGIYSCSFAYTASEITTIFDVWHTASGPGTFPYTEFHTGSAITVKTYDSKDYNVDQKYVSRLINLRPIYGKNEKARFRLFVREKDWSPTIYSKASENIDTTIIEDAYYKISRISDDFEVIPYGTGSLNHTRLSYDVSGNYFDLKMDLFDKGEIYQIQFTYIINGEYVEQKENFKFRIEE